MFVGTGLRKEGFVVDISGNGEEGQCLAEVNSYAALSLKLSTFV